MKDLVIFMPVFAGVPERVMQHNFDSYVRSNPEADVVKMNTQAGVDSYMKSICNNPLLAWRNCDLHLYDFYLRNPSYERYLYVEWDSYCNFDVRKMLDPVRSYDLACRKVIPRALRGPWSAFEQEARLVPTEYRSRLTALAPLCGVYASNKAMEKLSKPHPLKTIDLFCEVRLGTLAALSGLRAASYPMYGYTLSFEGPLTIKHVKGDGIYHRLKARYFPYEPPPADCPAVGKWFGPSPAGDRTIELTAEGSIRIDGKNKGQWMFIGQDREVILSWDDFGMEWYNFSPEVLFRGMRRLHALPFQ